MWAGPPTASAGGTDGEQRQLLTPLLASASFLTEDYTGGPSPFPPPRTHAGKRHPVSGAKPKRASQIRSEDLSVPGTHPVHFNSLRPLGRLHSSSTSKWIARHLKRFPAPYEPSSHRTPRWHLTAVSWDARMQHWFKPAECRPTRVSRPEVNRKRSGTGLQPPMRLSKGTSSQTARGTWTR